MFKLLKDAFKVKDIRSKILFTVFVLFVYTNIISATIKPVASTQLQPVIKEFKALIEHDPIVRMYITQMIEQIPPNNKNIKNA